MVVPFTVKLPDRVRFVNSGLSPVCSPVSTSVVAPLIMALTVPCDGEENAELEIIPDGS